MTKYAWLRQQACAGQLNYGHNFLSHFNLKMSGNTILLSNHQKINYSPEKYETFCGSPIRAEVRNLKKLKNNKIKYN